MLQVFIVSVWLEIIFSYCHIMFEYSIYLHRACGEMWRFDNNSFILYLFGLKHILTPC